MSRFWDDFGGYWGEHPDHPAADWQDEVRNGDTRQGYWGWVQREIALAEQAN